MLVKPNSAPLPRWLPWFGWAWAAVCLAWAVGQDMMKVSPMSTSVQGVPRDLFSRQFASTRPIPVAVDHQEWLAAFGDKVCHSILSLLLCISKERRLTNVDEVTRRTLFTLYFEAALAESHSHLASRGMAPERIASLLECLSRTILKAAPEDLSLFGRLLKVPDDQRLTLTVDEVMAISKAGRLARRDFDAAYTLMRLVVLMMTADLPSSL